LLVPALAFVVALFLYPFLYGLQLSFQPAHGGGPLANYRHFFADPFLRDTIRITLGIGVPAALINVVASVPIAYRMRGRFRGKRLLTILLVVVSAAAVVISVLLGTPAAYALARRDFPGKQLVTVMFLLPILLPPIAYGIPLATVLYKYHLAGTLAGVVLANLVPSVPFVILVMTPFIEQIDPRIESAARMCGAATRSVFLRVLGPLLVPGILAAAILVLVRTVGMFELTFLTAGSDSQTLIVALFYSVNAAGIRAQQSTDVMAVVYTLTMLVLLVIALRFVNPTQLVSQIKEEGTA